MRYVCINFLKRYDADNHYVLLATMNYIMENFKSQYINEIYKSLVEIIDNANQNQSA